VWYVDHASIGLDARVLVRTLWKVLVTREGLYGSGGTNDEFVGGASATADRAEESDAPGREPRAR
jgi:hypothetical protein